MCRDICNTVDRWINNQGWVYNTRKFEHVVRCVETHFLECRVLLCSRTSRSTVSLPYAVTTTISRSICIQAVKESAVKKQSFPIKRVLLLPKTEGGIIKKQKRKTEKCPAIYQWYFHLIFISCVCADCTLVVAVQILHLLCKYFLISTGQPVEALQYFKSSVAMVFHFSIQVAKSCLLWLLLPLPIIVHVFIVISLEGGTLVCATVGEGVALYGSIRPGF